MVKITENPEVYPDNWLVCLMPQADTISWMQSYRVLKYLFPKLSMADCKAGAILL